MAYTPGIKIQGLASIPLRISENLSSKPTQNKRMARELIITAFYLSLVLSCILIYSLGWTGSFHFDDEPNLSGLTVFQTTNDWFQFISTGDAGPGGRPIALATFLIDGLNWPDSAGPFLRTNSLIHALNGLLVALIFLHLTRHASLQIKIDPSLALLGSLIWLLLPILASTSLIVIQRMTLVAATFTLLGLFLYLIGRQKFSVNPRLGLFLMFLGVSGGVFLGFYSKENAVLLPLLILVTELTLFDRSRFRDCLAWRATFWSLLVAPTFILIAYLVWKIPNASFQERDFTLAERLSTQAVVLWDYLRLIFIPQSTAFTPFHDNQLLYDLPWRSLKPFLAFSAWVTVITAAFLMRKSSPVFIFATLWFLGAHSLESTVIPLELYYEHRNYVPSIGMVFGALIGAVLIGKRLKVSAKIGWTAGAAYIALLFVALAQTTSLWGSPAMAAELWYLEKPSSKRAALFVASQYIETGSPREALRILDRAEHSHKTSTGLALQQLQLSCQLEGPREQMERLQKASHLARIGIATLETAPTIFLLYEFSRNEECPETLTPDVLIGLIESLLMNRNLRGGNATRAQLHAKLATIYIDKRQLDQAMASIERSLAARFEPGIFALGVDALNSAGLHGEAYRFAREFAFQRRGFTSGHFLKFRHHEHVSTSIIDRQAEILGMEEKGHVGE
jgi:protein O-mannosyl-transferase